MSIERRRIITAQDSFQKSLDFKIESTFEVNDIESSLAVPKYVETYIMQGSLYTLFSPTECYSSGIIFNFDLSNPNPDPSMSVDESAIITLSVVNNNKDSIPYKYIYLETVQSTQEGEKPYVIEHEGIILPGEVNIDMTFNHHNSSKYIVSPELKIVPDNFHKYRFKYGKIPSLGQVGMVELTGRSILNTVFNENDVLDLSCIGGSYHVFNTPSLIENNTAKEYYCKKCNKVVVVPI